MSVLFDLAFQKVADRVEIRFWILIPDHVLEGSAVRVVDLPHGYSQKVCTDASR
jgi:hypothetical protein